MSTSTTIYRRLLLTLSLGHWFTSKESFVFSSILYAAVYSETSGGRILANPETISQSVNTGEAYLYANKEALLNNDD